MAILVYRNGCVARANGNTSTAVNLTHEERQRVLAFIDDHLAPMRQRFMALDAVQAATLWRYVRLSETPD